MIPYMLTTYAINTTSFINRDGIVWMIQEEGNYELSQLKKKYPKIYGGVSVTVIFTEIFFHSHDYVFMQLKHCAAKKLWSSRRSN
jgi:hypothetical protein